MKEFVEKLIERLEELRVRNFLTIANTGDEKLDCAYEYVGKVMDNTVSIVNELAEEYSEDGWILCSERLPEKYDEFLCLNDYGEYIIGYPRIKILSDSYYVKTDNEIMNDVIAWMPLPQPCKKGSE